jgi:hypothetical protein
MSFRMCTGVFACVFYTVEVLVCVWFCLVLHINLQDIAYTSYLAANLDLLTNPNRSSHHDLSKEPPHLTLLSISQHLRRYLLWLNPNALRSVARPVLHLHPYTQSCSRYDAYNIARRSRC